MTSLKTFGFTNQYSYNLAIIPGENMREETGTPVLTTMELQPQPPFVQAPPPATRTFGKCPFDGLVIFIW